MKNLSLTFCLTITALFGSVGSGFASDLPPCPSSGYKNNCFGTFTFASGNKYVGEVKDNKKHGQGTFTWADGNKYVGEFKDNKRTVQGTYTYVNGDKYVGEYRDGKRNEQGTYIYASGDKYVGEYKDDDQHGQGTYTWANGNKYLGEFLQNKRIGQGTFISNEDNSMLVGKFDGDLIDGFVILPDGFKLRAFQKDGKMVYSRVQNSNQNLDLLAKKLKRNNDLQTSRMLLDISKSLMGSNKNTSTLNLNNLNNGGGFLSGSSSSGMYRTCYYSSGLGTKTKTVFAGAPCPMMY